MSSADAVMFLVFDNCFYILCYLLFLQLYSDTVVLEKLIAFFLPDSFISPCELLLNISLTDCIPFTCAYIDLNLFIHTFIHVNF